MEIHLLPETGVRLSPPACQLAFGVAEHDVVAVLTSVGNVQDGFVCRLRAETPLSAKALALGDITMTCGFSGMPGTLHSVGVGRSADDPAGAVAVVFDDIDLLGWPTDDVVAGLRDAAHEVHHPGDGNVWIDDQLWLCYQPRPGRTPAGRKPRSGPPRHLNHVCLSLCIQERSW